MERDKKLRSVTRTRFTKVVNVLDSEISKTNADLGVIRDKFSKLKDIDFKLKDLDQKMLEHMMVADAEEDTLNCEIEEAEHYSDTFITLERKVRELIDSDNKSDVKSLGSSNGSLMAKSYKLPKIEMRKFDGELINWLPFWAQFEKIHEDTELHDADKFHYLVQSMQSNTRARELIESYPQTADNYAKAVQALKQRYGQKDLLVEIYVRELLKLMMANVKTPPDERRSVAKLYDKLETQLRSLESLGVDTKENTAWLFPMIESCLPEDVLVAWQRSPLNNCDESKNSNSNSSSRLNNLLDFLRREVEGEERRLLARRGFEGSSPKEKLRNKFKQNSNIPTAAGLFSAKEMGCLFCENNHQSKDCITAQSMPFKDKRAKIYEKRCCLKCLKPGHLAKACKRTVQCNICAKGHYVLLCPDLPCNRKEKTHVSEIVQSALANQQCTKDVTLMTLMVNIMGNNGYRRVRALLDPGSQKSYILESTALEVKLKPIGNVNIAHSLFGGTQTETKCHKVYTVALCSNLSELDTLREFEFLGQDIICGEIPRMPKGAWLNELKGSRIWLSDLGRDSPKIELLIGSDIYGSLLSGRVKQLENGLTAIETHLGWTICGPSPKKDEQTDYSSLLVISMHSRNMSVDYLWDLETIGIKDPRENLTKLEEDKIVHQHFLNTVHQLKDGRFCVGLPWLGNQEGIPSNRHIAERRLFNTTRKLRAKCIFGEYDRVFQEWLAEGVIEKVSPEDLNRNCHYLPHHPVVKANSNTTKIRPVFDASCKDKGNLSLNDCLASGPNVIEQIPAILLKFREKAIGVIADIRKAFLQIEVKEEDRDYLRFLWWKSNHQIQVFCHKRVVFGVTCSPYLLGAVILHHLKGVSSEFGALPQKLMECLYIDNCVTSVDTEAELVDLVEKSTEIFAKAKMDLRMWQFGPIHRVKEVYSRLPPSVDIERSEEASVLGMKWNLLEDTLNVTPKFGVIINSLSKRDLLSHTQQIFDPIGFLAPVLLPAKLLIQQAWTVKTDWDEPLPTTIQENFMKWYSELDTLADIKIPRRVGHGIRAHWSIHIFCDASQSAYAAAAFLRCPENKGVSVQLLVAKSRLGPLKKTTIPRMELLACMLGVRLSRYITESLNLAAEPVYYWTDSTTALSWIKTNRQWGTFVNNRVKEICNTSGPNKWLYVPGSLNPADLPSRGCSVLQLKRTRWWEGPEWLKQPQDHWPKQLFHSDRTLVNLEIDRQVLVTTHARTEVMPWFERFSNFTKIVRINAWIRRFIRNTQKLSPSGMHSLQLSELEDAEKGIWKTVQQQVFSSRGDSINGLMIIRDDFGLIRIKSKLIERDDEYSFRYPILLPTKHHVVTCLIREFHLRHCHAGVQILSAKLRENYWILNSRRSIRSVVSQCAKCRRFSSKPVKTTPIHLPLDRVRDATAFEILGVDLAGPLYLKNKTKAWIVLFTCAVFRAIHLELVTSLSTEAFIQALRRFIARRGRPTVIYSDNGTNFVGANNALKALNWKKIVLDQNLHKISWKFIPPTAAWWGGWWERLIRSIKDLLVRILGHSSVYYEEMSTILCDAEATINSRPLTYIHEDFDSLIPLSPSMFLHDSKYVGVPDLDKLDSKKFQDRYRHCQRLREALRSRFRSEYLGQLVQKANERTPKLSVGDVVIVKVEDKRRLHWPMARIVELFPGRDGHSRVAKVRTKLGTLIRPVQKLYPLEVSSGDPILRSKGDTTIEEAHSGSMLNIHFSGQAARKHGPIEQHAVAAGEGLARSVRRTIENVPTRGNNLSEEVLRLGKNLLEALSNRFGDRLNVELINQAIFLDPRFKKHGFGENTSRFLEVKNKIIEKIQSSIPATTVGPVAPGVRPVSASSIWEDFDAAVNQFTAAQDPKANATIQVDKYLAEPIIDRRMDPLVWWHERKTIFPDLFLLMQKRLCIPATSVPCERLFSKAGNICTQKRSCLTSSKVCPAGLFDSEDTEQEMAFQLAATLINSDNSILPRSTLVPVVEKVERDDSFHATKKGTSFISFVYECILPLESRQDSEMELNQDPIGVKSDGPTETMERRQEVRESEPARERQEVTGRETTAPLADAVNQLSTLLTRVKISDGAESAISPFDGTYSATQFFQTFDRKMEDASMEEQEKLLRLPNYLVRQPLELFRKLRLADRSYFQVRQTLLDLYPESSEASFAKYFAMKLTGQANLETYYREKTAMGLQLGLPQEVILETLTEGLPFNDQRLVRVVPPKNLGEWFRLVQRIHGPSVPATRSREDQPPTMSAFATFEGLYQPTRLPFGLKTSPQIYERAISQVLQRHGLDCVAHYFDDFIIYSNTLEEHQNHLRQFFAFCEAEKLQLNFAKCEFFKQSINFLGYTITAGTITPLTRNTDIIHAIKQPHNRKTLQSFLGAVNVYNKFIPEYARLRAPLNNLLKKDVVWNWNEACQEAFIDLKGNLTQHPILHLYKEGLPCQVYCDASTLGIAGILKQVHPDGNVYPVQYFSRTLRPHEKNYSISELECLAIVESVEKFRIYLMGRKFTIFSDHHALQWLKTIKNPSGRLFRWSLRLSSYEYEVRYIKGKLQYEADLLSRNPFCGFLDATLIKTHQPPPSKESSLIIDHNGLHTVSRKGVTKIILPKPLIQQLLQTVHTQYNHPGISQMSRIISTQYYWQGMSKDIKQKVKTCPTCQLTKRPVGPTYGELSQPPESKEPFDLLSLDTIAGFAKYGNTKIYLHVVVDHFSRYAWAFPSKSTSTTTYQQVLKRVFQDGSPKRLLTDRAPAFTSPKFRSFLLNRNIHPLLTTSNNPQANGLCERLNATLTGKLRLLHLENPKVA
ncbi:hypothetical protein LAZ67_18002470 [Cordylochernes scorpioides]|uniref:Pro-Pol polyprotein n=1 Tax=Cordylochernes scorpioides TaxID=51811 RepID=A0ABY6LGS3_9ARAC|nr:hypothetical protein LAZ67_18002470 [Cordylochernes scorpioides]